MTVAGIQLLAVILATIASYVFGAIWYTSLAKSWLAALGKTKAELSAAINPPWLRFVVTFFAQLLMAVMLAGLMGHMGPLTLRSGLITAALCWLGFVVPTMAANHSFQGAKRSLTLIDGGHWLGVLLIQGAVLGAMGAG